MGGGNGLVRNIGRIVGKFGVDVVVKCIVIVVLHVQCVYG